ncbi:MAG: AAA family ATPase [Candidatus Bathyarchaeia archaeon]
MRREGWRSNSTGGLGWVILKKVRLENFVSHRSSELEFDYGVNVITGPNGAGKTSILDAVSFGLFNLHGRGRKENLINQTADESRVAVEFQEGGLTYGVEWSVDRWKPANGVLFRVQNGARVVLARGGERVITSEVEKILGFDRNLFQQSIYVRQGEIESLVSATPAARKEVIAKLLGVEDLEKAYQGMRDLINEYQVSASRLAGELSRKPTVEKQLEGLRREMDGLKATLRLETRRLAKVERELKTLEEKLRMFEEKKARFHALNSKRVVLEAELTHLKRTLSEKEAELSEAETAYRKVMSLKEAVEKLPLMERYVKLSVRKGELEREVELQRQTLLRLDELENTLLRNEDRWKEYEEKSLLVARMRKTRESYEGAGEALKEVEKRVRQDTAELEEKERRLSRELMNFSQIIGEAVKAENIEAAHARKIGELQALKGRLRERADELKLKVGGFEQKLAELEFKLDGIVEAEACPVCGKKLTPQHRIKLQSELEEARKEVEASTRRLTSELEKVKEEEKRCELELQRTMSIDPKKIVEAAVEVAELRRKLAREKMDVKKLEKKAETLKRIDGEIKRLEAQLGGLEEPHREYEFAKREIARWPPRQEVDDSLKEASSRLEALSGELEALTKRLGFKPVNPEGELAELRAKKVEHDKSEPIAEKRSRLQADLSEVRQRIASVGLELDNVLKKLDALGYREDEHRRMSETFEGKRRLMGDAEKAVVEVEARLRAVEGEKLMLEAELSQLSDREVEKRRVEAFIKTLEMVRRAFHKDGAQKLIRGRARPLLEKTMWEFFEKFNLDYSNVTLDDDYNITVTGPAGSQAVEQLSGGERVALAVALRLAIARILSGKVETIMMDEPTIHLDEERRRELINILNTFFKEGGRITPQMIVITHHAELQDIADVAYTVNKKEGFSTVEASAG